MDETDKPQTPPELLVILAAIADEHVPIQNDCAEVYRTLQQGCRLRWRCNPIHNRVQKATSR